MILRGRFVLRSFPAARLGRSGAFFIGFLVSASHFLAALFVASKKRHLRSIRFFGHERQFKLQNFAYFVQFRAVGFVVRFRLIVRFFAIERALAMPRPLPALWVALRFLIHAIERFREFFAYRRFMPILAFRVGFAFEQILYPLLVLLPPQTALFLNV